MGGSRARCVVLFTDLVGFTELSARLEPAPLFALLNRYFEAIAAAVIEQQGLVDKFIGDALMAEFGVPRSRGDAAEALAAATAANEAPLRALDLDFRSLLEGGLLTRTIVEFVSHSEPVRAAAMVPMRVMGICTPLIAVGMILTQALFGAGNSKFVMVVELVLHFTCLVPLAWILGITLGLGLAGIWAAAVVYIVLLCATMVWKFASGDWKAIRL